VDWGIPERAYDAFYASPTSFDLYVSGEERWIVRVDLDSETGCDEPGKIRRLDVWAEGEAGPRAETAARIVFRGDCKEGSYEFLEAATFNPALRYWRD